jgi:hypothetical protein
MTDDHENHNRADDVDSDLQDGPTSGYSASLEDRIAAFAQQDVSLDDELRKAASKKTDEQRAKERKFIIFGVLGLISNWKHLIRKQSAILRWRGQPVQSAFTSRRLIRSVS